MLHWTSRWQTQVTSRLCRTSLGMDRPAICTHSSKPQRFVVNSLRLFSVDVDLHIEGAAASRKQDGADSMVKKRAVYEGLWLS